MAKYLRVTYVKSAIGNLQRHKDTIRALGLRKLGRTVEVADTPSMRGMVNSVIHLVKVEEVERADAPSAANGQTPAPGGPQ